MKKLFKVFLTILAGIVILSIFNYVVFDFHGLVFCDYKSIGENINLVGNYDLLEVAKKAQSNGLKTEIRYIDTGPQLTIIANHFGAEYRVLLRYLYYEHSQIEITFFDAREKAACLTPNLFARFFIWKMFHDSGLETGWMFNIWIHHVIYWGPSF